MIGASGQDGYFLTERLLDEDWTVYAFARHPEDLASLAKTTRSRRALEVHPLDLLAPQPLFELIARELPTEIYNLAGQSSVAVSFAEPLLTWRTNAEFVATLLECVRLQSPRSHLYQASSTEMFGGGAGGTLICDEHSVLNPQSPYASAKAAAHMLCRSYREDYDLRIACGILSNHESYRRPANFLTRKITDHVARLRHSRPSLAATPPLKIGNLKIRRDWGFAPEYVEGMRLILRQMSVRAARGESAPDEGRAYRDYLLGTGQTHAVWELVDTAFRLAEFDLEWNLASDDPLDWHAVFRSSGKLAVKIDPVLLRPADPLVIRVDPSRAQEDLGWTPRRGLEVFLSDMLDHPLAA